MCSQARGRYKTYVYNILGMNIGKYSSLNQVVYLFVEIDYNGGGSQLCNTTIHPSSQYYLSSERHRDVR